MNLTTKHEVINVNACKTVKVEDLGGGVAMNANMKVSEQCRIAASNGTTWMEAISMESHRYMLDKIQRRPTKLISGLRDLSYEERLKERGQQHWKRNY